MEINHILNKNAQSSPKAGKAAAHVYMLSRAEARKRRPKGVYLCTYFLDLWKKKPTKGKTFF